MPHICYRENASIKINIANKLRANTNDEWTNFEIVHCVEIFLQLLYEEHEYRSELTITPEEIALLEEKPAESSELDEDLLSQLSNLMSCKSKCTMYIPGEYDRMFQAYENGEDVDEDLLSHLSYLKSCHQAREEKQQKTKETSAIRKTSSLDEVD